MTEAFSEARTGKLEARDWRIRMRRPIIIVFFTLSLGIAYNASADVLFDNGSPDLANAFHSDFDTSSPSDTVQVGNEFSLSTPGRINHVRFYGLYASDSIPPAFDDFTIRIFEVTGGVPDVNPLYEFDVASVSRAATGDVIFGFDLYTHEASFPLVFLEAGSYSCRSSMTRREPTPTGTGHRPPRPRIHSKGTWMARPGWPIPTQSRSHCRWTGSPPQWRTEPGKRLSQRLRHLGPIGHGPGWRIV